MNLIRRAIPATAAIIAVALLVAACGGATTTTSTSGTDAAAGNGGSGGAAGGPPKNFLPDAYKYSACMRNHGVSDFPDPVVTHTGNGTQVSIHVSQADGTSPQFKTAQQACRGILPAPSNADLAAQAQQQRIHGQDLVAFARCLRGRGIDGFPDPNAQGDWTLQMIQAARDRPHGAAGSRGRARVRVGVERGDSRADVLQATSGNLQPSSRQLRIGVRQLRGNDREPMSPVRVRSIRRAMPAAALAAGVALVAAGCGGSSSATTSTNSAGGQSTDNPVTQAYRYAACMRDHGVANFPDPHVSISGGSTQISMMAKGNPNGSPPIQAAQTACRGILPGPSSVNPGAQAQQQRARTQDELSLRTACGVTASRLPGSARAAGRLTLPMIQAAGIDLTAPQFRTAALACIPASNGILTRQAVMQATSGNPAQSGSQTSASSSP